MRGEILFYSDFPFGYHNREAEEKMTRFAARGYRVHYVEQLGLRNPSLRHFARLLRGMRNESLGKATPFAVVSAKLLPPRRVPGVDAFNRWWLSRQLLSRLGDPRETIFWVRYPTPELVPLVESAPWRLVVYEAVDDHESTPGMNDKLRRVFRAAEERVLARARVVFAWSEPIRDRLAARHGNVVLAPAAVDVDMFGAVADARPPSERVAVYVGALDFRFDAELLASAARLLTDWTFVIVGPARDRAEAPLADLANVRLLGRRDVGDVPALLAGGRVCLMPYRRGAFSDMLFPIKLVEYLAAGKPIVSTSIRASRELAGLVSIADDGAAFARAIESAAAADSEEARRLRVAEAQRFSWDRWIDEMEAAIEAAMPRA